MYRIGINGGFASAHFLRGYAGTCEALHGHNYKVEAVVTADSLDDVGLGIDFRRLREKLGGVLAELDHRLLNDLPEFAEQNPSAELISRLIFRRLAAALAAEPVTVAEVKVWESEGCWATYCP
jgi:6-pyruvoyltetrahydropterin/6-carboxytetrahydropterin synthase